MLAEEIFGSETVKRERRHFSADQKVAMLRRHLIEKVPVSKLCEEAGVAPNLFYRWQDQLFQNGVAALEFKRQGERVQEQARVQKLENKLRQKDEVLAELMTEHIALKKQFGEL